jgi:hypothetical protein
MSINTRRGLLFVGVFCGDLAALDIRAAYACHALAEMTKNKHFPPNRRKKKGGLSGRPLIAGAGQDQAAAFSLPGAKRL